MSAVLPALPPELDKVCDDFESAWRAAGTGGPVPRLEDLLPHANPAARLSLLRELVVLELNYRCQRGEGPASEEYLQRFPELGAAWLEQELARQQAESAPGPATLAFDWARTVRGPLPDVPGYVVLEELGRGSMGVVYKARHVALGRLCALKMVLSGGNASETELARFKTEREALARLQHPHIVGIYEVGQHQGQPFFSLELCPGGSLDRKVRGTPLVPAEAAQLVKALAEAMHAAHSAGVVHRDLKPGNVLLTVNGTPKVTDFGLARKLDDVGQTQTGAILGTPSYMAPEQAEGKKAVGPPADVYALGAILYDCLTGRPPFKAATTYDTILQVLNEEPVAPTLLSPKVPRDLETIALKCLRKEPDKRYASAQELADDLRRFLDGEPIRARRVGRVERAVKWARRSPTKAALLAVTVLAGLTLSVGGWWSHARLKAALAQSEANATELREERQRADSSFRKNLDTIDDLVINLDGRLARIQGLDQPSSKQQNMEPVRLEFLREFLAIAERLQQENANDPVARRQRGRVWARLGEVSFQSKAHARGDHSFRQALQIQEALVKDFPQEAQYQSDLALTHAEHARALLRRQKVRAAQSGLKKAFTIQDRLARQFPDQAVYRLQAERYRFEHGNAQEEGGKTDAARGDYFQALVSVEKMASTSPSAELDTFIGLIADSLGALLMPTEPVEALRMLEGSLEARRKAWKREPQRRAHQQGLRSAYLVLGEALRQKGKHAEVAALAERLVIDTPDPRLDLYNAACLMARAAQAAGQSKTGPEQKKLVDGYAERAVKLLEKATLAGYASARDEREHLDRDPDLAPLRQRADYGALLARLDAALPPEQESPSQEVNSLIEEYRNARRRYASLHGEAVTFAQKARASTESSPVAAYCARFLELAEKHKDSSAAPVALAWLLSQTMPQGQAPPPVALAQLRARALEAIQRDQLNQPNLDEVCRLLAGAAEPQGDRVLTVLHQKHSHERIRGVASMALAISRATQARRCRSTDPLLSQALNRQAEAQFEEVIARYKGVRLSKTTMGDVAGKWLRDVRFLVVGSPAQEIEGKDLNGQHFKLSDYRGKVVVLDFWANWCGYCRAEYEPTKALVKRLEGRPFAFLGINCDEDREVVKGVVRRQGLNWRSWYDGGPTGGQIRRQWQIYRFPTVYVLDAKGIIRHKDLRGKALEDAVDRLLNEHERKKVGARP
jgi:thiol-disulfide isomerase/thioredoxin